METFLQLFTDPLNTHCCFHLLPQSIIIKCLLQRTAELKALCDMKTHRSDEAEGIVTKGFVRVNRGPQNFVLNVCGSIEIVLEISFVVLGDGIHCKITPL